MTRRRATTAVAAAAALTLVAAGVAAMTVRADDVVVAQAASPSPSPSPSASRAPVNRLDLELTVSPARPRVGELVTLTFVARGDAAKPLITGLSYDGSTASGGGPGCLPPEEPPPPPEPGETRQVVEHRYTAPGTYKVGFSASSGCSYYEGYGSKKIELVVDP